MNRSVCAAILLAGCFSIAHAENCTPPADEYFGTLSPDGVCHPLDKSVAKFFDRTNDCTPELQDRGNMWTVPEKCALAPEFLSGCTPPADEYVGMWGSDGKCHPIHKIASLPANRLTDFNGCTPDLRGRGTLTLSLLSLHGKDELVCDIPVQRLPRSPVEDLQQQLDELRDEVERLKSKRP
jgi:hypothetical protein